MDGRSRKRRRVAVACEYCRDLKRRCDGKQPACSACFEAERSCTYPPQTVVLRRHDRLKEVIERLGALEQLLVKREAPPVLPLVFKSPSPDAASPGSSSHYGDRDLPENMPEGHNSSTDDVVWDNALRLFPDIMYDYRSTFELEHARPPLSRVFHALDSAAPPAPTPAGHAAVLHELFSQTVNFWYPVVPFHESKRCVESALRAESADPLDAMLGQLVLSLGAGADRIAKALNHSHGPVPSCHETMHALKLAQQHVCVAIGCESVIAVQCLFLMLISLLHLQRPLEAHAYAVLVANKVRLLLNYASCDAGSEDLEILRRVQWACFILEGDLTAELDRLPQSGLSALEDNVALPDMLATQESADKSQESTLYFLACISIRRLLNHAHYLLFGAHRGDADGNKHREARVSPQLMAELARQLEEWRSLLPEFLGFSDDIYRCKNEHASFIRQRYYTCKSLIYRPYLNLMLAADTSPTHDVARGSRICLEACCFHIVNLHGMRHTVLTDTWICSLSMTACIIQVLLAANKASTKSMVPAFARSLGHQLSAFFTTCLAATDITELVAGDAQGIASPTVLQCIKTIERAGNRIDMLLTA